MAMALPMLPMTVETFAVPAGKQRLDLAPPGFDDEQPAPVIGDHERAVAPHLRPIRLAVVLGYERPRSARGDPEDPSVRDVSAVKIALGVEARSFEEAVDRFAGLVGDDDQGFAVGRKCEVVHKLAVRGAGAKCHAARVVRQIPVLDDAVLVAGR